MGDRVKPTITAMERATAIPGMLLFGTTTVVTSKILFEMTSKNSNGEVVAFEKPWWQVLMMFLGMCSCLIVYEIQKCQAKTEEEKKPLMQSETVKIVPFFTKYKEYFQIFPPAMCDLVATALMYIGFVFVTASIFQLMRGSMVLFSAIFCRIFLNKKIQRFHVLGIVIILLGLVCVGLACINGDTSGGTKHSQGQQILGICLIVAAQVVQAGQIVVEQHLLQNNNMPPALIVGTEGVWGTVVSLFIVLPAMEFIPNAEKTYDTLVMMGNNHNLIWGTIIYIIAILFYNLFGMRVTQQYTAVHRTILESVRTGCIWMTDLFIYYQISSHYGEFWDNWSYVELGGFAFVLTGTFIYNQVIKIPCLVDAKPQFAAIEDNRQ
jgi:drug/metabolite transporter (DMT)-like permease